MQDKLKESISKSEHFGWVICRERGRCNFFLVGKNPKENFFSQEGTNPKELGSFPRHLVSVELYCSVQSVQYSSGTDFENNNSGHDF